MSSKRSESDEGFPMEIEMAIMTTKMGRSTASRYLRALVMNSKKRERVKKIVDDREKESRRASVETMEANIRWGDGRSFGDCK
jgi:hypothetical protein